ncbi:MAG: hypothetical protein RR255_00225 [Bacilli bacterium]
MVTLKELIEARRKKENKRKKPLTKEQHEEQIIDWCDFYRKNWDIYAEQDLGITALHPFQSIVLYLAGISQVFYFMCSRGMSKSFLSALISFIICLLYPNSEIVITATTMKTAKKMVKNKMQKELCGDYSPKLKYLYEHDLIHFTIGDEDIRVDFKMNNSWILVLPETDSSRGERVTGLIFEEYRQSKPSIVNSVFIPMRRARRAAYLFKEEFKEDKRLIENARIIYLTSTGYKFEHFWETWKTVIDKMFDKNSKTKYIGFAGDIVTSVYHNLVTEEDFELVKNDQSISEMEIEMEYYNVPQGEIEGSYYSMKQFKDNSVIENGFIPPTYEEFVEKYDRGNIPYFREKKDDEIRIIYVDFAFSDTVIKNQDNDNTVIGCMSGYPNEERVRILRNVDYMETYSGGDKEKSLKRIRELFYLYCADYFIYDNLNGGQDRFVDLSKPYYHEELGIEMNGFGISTETNITDGFCEENKVANLSNGVIDSNSIPVSIPVVGSSERNNNYHIVMKNSLKNNTIRFLMDEIELKKKLLNDKEFMFMDSYSKSRRLIGHVQIDLMINEAIKLEKKIVKGYIKLEEPRTGTKDRIVATEYGNYFFYLKELEMVKKEQENTTDLEDIQLVY